MGPQPAESDALIVSGAKTFSNCLAGSMSSELPSDRSGSKGMALAAEISTRTVCAGEAPAKTRSAAKKMIWQRNSSFMEFSQKGYCYDLIWRKQLKGERSLRFGVLHDDQGAI